MTKVPQLIVLLFQSKDLDQNRSAHDKLYTNISSTFTSSNFNNSNLTKQPPICSVSNDQLKV